MEVTDKELTPAQAEKLRQGLRKFISDKGDTFIEICRVEFDHELIRRINRRRAINDYF